MVVGLLLPGTPTVASAGPNEGTRIELHLVPVDGPTRDPCRAPIPSDPATYRLTGDLGREYLVYVLLTDFDSATGITGVQFGIDFDDSLGVGVDVLRWQRCATLEFPSDGWPRASTGNLLTWVQTGDCRHEAPVVVGVFRVRAATPGSFTLVPRPVDGLAAVAGCGSPTGHVNDRIDRLLPDHLARADFGGGPGYNPHPTPAKDN